MKKKLLAITLTGLLLITAFAGCGKKNNNTASQVSNIEDTSIINDTVSDSSDNTAVENKDSSKETETISVESDKASDITASAGSDNSDKASVLSQGTLDTPDMPEGDEQNDNSDSDAGGNMTGTDLGETPLPKDTVIYNGRTCTLTYDNIKSAFAKLDSYSKTSYPSETIAPLIEGCAYVSLDEINYAKKYIAQKVNDYNSELAAQGSDVHIVKTYITEISEVTPGTIGTFDGITLFIIHYKLQLSGDFKGTLNDGAEIVDEDGTKYITENTYGGQPFIVMYVNWSETDACTREICIVNTSYLYFNYLKNSAEGDALAEAILDLARKNQ